MSVKNILSILVIILTIQKAFCQDISANKERDNIFMAKTIALVNSNSLFSIENKNSLDSLLNDFYVTDYHFDSLSKITFLNITQVTFGGILSALYLKFTPKDRILYDSMDVFDDSQQVAFYKRELNYLFDKFDCHDTACLFGLFNKKEFITIGYAWMHNFYFAIDERKKKVYILSGVKKNNFIEFVNDNLVPNVDISNLSKKKDIISQNAFEKYPYLSGVIDFILSKNK